MFRLNGVFFRILILLYVLYSVFVAFFEKEKDSAVVRKSVSGFLRKQYKFYRIIYYFYLMLIAISMFFMYSYTPIKTILQIPGLILLLCLPYSFGVLFYSGLSRKNYTFENVITHVRVASILLIYLPSSKMTEIFIYISKLNFFEPIDSGLIVALMEVIFNWFVLFAGFMMLSDIAIRTTREKKENPIFGLWLHRKIDNLNRDHQVDFFLRSLTITNKNHNLFRDITKIIKKIIYPLADAILMFTKKFFWLCLSLLYFAIYVNPSIVLQEINNIRQRIKRNPRKLVLYIWRLSLIGAILFKYISLLNQPEVTELTKQNFLFISSVVLVPLVLSQIAAIDKE